jgi:N6-adenosine-specific RNA methylase IME4
VSNYQVIYADPPWWYGQRLNGNTKFGRGAGVYPQMKTPEICALPVQSLAAKDAILFMWATCPLLPDALRVIEAWGFKFKTVAFTWIKLNQIALTPKFGTGYYSKSNSELCLLATKGGILKPATDGVSSVVMTPIGEHSRKPDTVRHRIELMYPDLPKVELFARPINSLLPVFEDWHIWGNEVESDIALAI